MPLVQQYLNLQGNRQNSNRCATVADFFFFFFFFFFMTAKDLWTFPYLTCSRLVLSLPFIYSFATRYFSHLFDLSRFATTFFFAVVRQLTINYSLTTGIHQSLLIRSVIRTFTIDFNCFLTCLDSNSFKHSILLFYYVYFKLLEKEKNIIAYTADRGGGGVIKYEIGIYVPHRV